MEQHIVLLKQFVTNLRENPGLLHHSSLDFFREYLEELGAKIPPKSEENEKTFQEEMKTPEPMEEEPPIPYPSDIDESGVIEADTDEALAMGDLDKEVSEEDVENANQERDNAMEAVSDGNLEKALKHYTNAIMLNPSSAILHAKRASLLLQLKRPVAAINDCTKAISINSDSAQAYKFRGRANRLLGKWIEAHTDLAIACKLDYDETANEWLKEVEQNAKKIQEYNRAVARQAEEKDLRERRERVRRAQETNRKAQEDDEKSASDDFMSGNAGNMFGLDDLFKDPEMTEAIKDPQVMSAIMDILSNPQNLIKHVGNPKVMKIMTKLEGMKGGVKNMFGGGCGSCPSSTKCGSSNCEEGGSAPRKAPEPDLD